MTIFIAEKHIIHEGLSILGVFNSLVDAEKACDDDQSFHDEKSWNMYCWRVSEWEVDSEQS